MLSLNVYNVSGIQLSIECMESFNHQKSFMKQVLPHFTNEETEAHNECICSKSDHHWEVGSGLSDSIMKS